MPLPHFNIILSFNFAFIKSRWSNGGVDDENGGGVDFKILRGPLRGHIGEGVDKKWVDKSDIVCIKEGMPMEIDSSLRLVAIGILIYEGLEQNGEEALEIVDGKLNVDADLCDEHMELALKLCSAIDPDAAQVNFEYLEGED